MKKLMFLCILLFSFSQTYANTWPAQVAANGTLKISNNNLLWESVEVKKEILIFEWKEREKKSLIEEYYPWEEYFLEKYKNSPKVLEYISENTLDWEKSQFLHSQPKTPIKFYNIYWKNHLGKYFQVKVKYVLKNTSPKNILPQKVVFSSLQPKKINMFHLAEWVEDLSFMDYLVVHYPSSMFPKDMTISVNGKNIPTYKNVVLSQMDKSVLWTSNTPKNILYTKEVNVFMLWFQPYEEKILEISYEVDASIFYNSSESFMTSYDFSPIFSWKWAKIGEVEVEFIPPKDYFLERQSTVWWKDFLYKDGKYMLKKQNVTQKDIWKTLDVPFVHISMSDNLFPFQAPQKAFCTFEEWCDPKELTINVCFERSKICNSKYIDKVKEMEYWENWNIKLHFLDGTFEEKFIFDYVER